MKNKFFALCLMFAWASTLTAQTLTFTAGLAEVSTSTTKNDLYNSDELYYIYNTSTGGFEARLVETRAIVYAANISTVTISGISTAAAKITWLENTHVKANTGVYNVLVPKNGLSVRYRVSVKKAELAGRYSMGKSPLWYGHIDSVKTSESDNSTALRLAALRKMVRPGVTTNLSNSTSGLATIVAGAAAGTGPTVSIDGDNLSGEITINTGSSTTTTGIIATITFPVACPNKCYLFLEESGAASALEDNDVSVTTTSNTGVLSASGNALTASTNNFKWFYHRICR
jgi:hypothetical protein